MSKTVKVPGAGILLLLGFATVGCGGPGISPPADAQHWADQIRPGTSADEAKQFLAENDFEHWQDGRVIYGYRDKVASKDYSDGVVLSVYLDDSNRVAYTETYASPSSPYPMVWPTYP
jgi:hypothetical protein